MPVITYQQARQRLSAGEVPGLILLHGDEEYLERELLRLLRKALERTGGAVDYLEWEEESGEAERFISLATLPFGAEKRLVVAADPTAAAAKSYLQVVNPSLVLVLLYHAKVRQSDLVLKKVSLQGWVVLCTPLKGRELTVRLQEEARARHKVLSQQAAEYLHFLCGDSLAHLCQEIEKVSLFLGSDQREITVPVLKQVGSRTTMRSVFELSDAVAAGRPDQVRVVAEDLLRQGESPVLLTALLSRHFLQLLEAACLLQEGVMPQRLSEVLEVHPYVAKKIQAQVRAVSIPEIEHALSLLLDLDHRIKQGQGAPELLLEAALSELCMKKPLAGHSKR